jgi:hypothetical protein
MNIVLKSGGVRLVPLAAALLAGGAGAALATGGDKGPRAAHVGYARVMADGTLDLARTKNVTDVSTVTPENIGLVYCIDLAFTPRTTSATVGEGGGYAPAVSLAGTGTEGSLMSQCPSTAEAAVYTANTPETFYIQFVG